ncbi:MAG: hypothetical protein KJ006_00495 [Thermoleophilia bacterium]|nr:hypothetical protein [Thermoleophilia bacterium]
MAVTAMALVALIVPGPLAVDDADGRKKCRHGKIAWKIEGERVCRKPPATSRRPASEGSLLGRVVGPAAVRRVGRWRAIEQRPMTPRSWLRTSALVARVAESGVERIRGGTAPRLAAAAVRASAVRRAGGSFSESIPAQSVGDGVTVSGAATGGVDGSGKAEVDISLTAEKGGYALDLKPSLSIGAEGGPPRCPTAEGRLAWDESLATKNTVIAREGNRVLGAVTDELNMRNEAVGRVGADARLESVTVRQVIETGHYERGIQLNARISSVTTLGRNGGTEPGASPKVEVRIRAAKASRADEAAAERRAAAAIASDIASSKLGETLAGSAVRARDRALKQEPNWYEFGNPCVTASFSPSPGTAAEGETGTTTGSFKMDGSRGRPAASWKQIARGRGEVTPKRASSGPGSDPKFKWTAGRSESGPLRRTLDVQYEVTSRAGRDQASLIATAPPAGDLKVEVVGSFSGENDRARASVDTDTVIWATPVPGDDPGTNWQAREPYHWDARSPAMYGKGGCSAVVTGASGEDFVTYPPAGVATKVAGGYLVYLTPIIAVEGTVSGGPCGSPKPWFVFPTLYTVPGLILKVNGTGPTRWTDSGIDPAGYPGSYDLTITITELEP